MPYHPVAAGVKQGICSILQSFIIISSYFHQQKTSVKSALLDCSKAFDKCLFSVLFGKVLDRGVPAIFVRGLLGIYQKQHCWVHWSGGLASHVFGVGNGTRQGSCISPALFSVYIDELLQELIAAGVGCWVGGEFAGAGSYCDDLVLLAPTRSALQKQMSICQEYANKHNLVFSTHPDPKKSRTKCLLFRLHTREEVPDKIMLNGHTLPWVDNAAHLGHELHTTGSQDMDCRQGRNLEKFQGVLDIF